MYGQQNCPPLEPAASRGPSVARSRGLASRRLFRGLVNPRVGIAQLFSTVFVPLLSAAILSTLATGCGESQQAADTTYNPPIETPAYP
jgi:hypothetical protein